VRPSESDVDDLFRFTKPFSHNKSALAEANDLKNRIMQQQKSPSKYQPLHAVNTYQENFKKL
jgi:hypothetical protein